MSAKSPDEHGQFDVGARLLEIRTRNGLTQRQLADRAGVPHGQISMIERNHSSPSISSLRKILRGVPMTMADFFLSPATQAAPATQAPDSIISPGEAQSGVSERLPDSSRTPGSVQSQSGTLCVRVLRTSLEGEFPRDDWVAVEAPLEFQLHHPDFGDEPVSFGTTMRTPGDDEALAAGLLYGEGVINRAADVVTIETSTRRPNVVNVRLHPSVQIEVRTPARRFSAGSSCGVCGTTGLDTAIARAAATRIADSGSAALSVLLALPARMRTAQSRFADTGGIHAAALFDFEGSLLAVAEDVGRHNAFDKLIGARLLADATPLAERIVLLSGRASFELVQKALRAGVAVLAAIGAPSSLAVNLAAATGLTLVGFLRDTHCNVYTHPQRLTR